MWDTGNPCNFWITKFKFNDQQKAGKAKKNKNTEGPRLTRFLGLGKKRVT